MIAALKHLAALAFMVVALLRFSDALSTSEEELDRSTLESLAHALVAQAADAEGEMTIVTELAGNSFDFNLKLSPEAIFAVKIGNSAAAEPVPIAGEAADECND